MNNFSKEYLFSEGIYHALGIEFKPNSEAFHTYGRYVVVNLVLSDDEEKELAKNKLSNPPVNTYGTLRAQLTHPQELTEEQEIKLQSQGFNTADIDALYVAKG